MSTIEAGRRVLLAEDEAIIRLDLREMLQEEGYEVVAEAGDGQSAVRLADELRPDVVVMDIKMPGLDGLSAAERISGKRIAPVLLDRARGVLMNQYGMVEADAFRFLQKTAMDRRLKMREVARRVVDGEMEA